MELVVIFGIALLSLVVAAYLAQFVLKQDTGTPEMQKISNAIKEGAEAFLKRMNKTIAALSVAFAVLLFLFYVSHKNSEYATKMTIGKTQSTISPSTEFVLAVVPVT